jgi:hypothetical protein
VATGLQYIAMPVVPMDPLVEMRLKNLLESFRPTTKTTGARTASIKNKATNQSPSIPKL